MELTAPQRFFAVAAAQFGGVLLLLFIGLIPFAEGQPNLAIGIRWIIYSMATTAGALILAMVITRHRAKKLQGIDDVAADRAINLFLIVDIPVVFFLVCQEGGLCRSIFIPLFFLIPMALLIVEPPDRMRRTYIVLASISVGITLSYFISRHVGVPASSGIHSLSLPGGISLKLTYFDDDAHPGYDLSIFLVSLVSVVIPLVQKWLIGFTKDVIKQ